SGRSASAIRAGASSTPRSRTPRWSRSAPPGCTGPRAGNPAARRCRATKAASARWCASVADVAPMWTAPRREPVGRRLVRKPPPRHEVRVSPCDDGWDVRPGENGETYRFASEHAALGCALELARRAWADHDRLSCVKCFAHDTWDV